MERNLSPRRRAYDLAMRALVWLSALLTCALLVFLIGYIFYRGAGSVTWDFLSGTSSYIKDTIGILPNILNTLYIILLAAARRGSRHLSHGVRREPQGRRAH